MALIQKRIKSIYGLENIITTVQNDISSNSLKITEIEKNAALRLDSELNGTDIANITYNTSDTVMEVLYVTGNRIELFYNQNSDLELVKYFDKDSITHIFTQKIVYDMTGNIIQTAWSKA